MCGTRYDARSQVQCACTCISLTINISFALRCKFVVEDKCTVEATFLVVHTSLRGIKNLWQSTAFHIYNFATLHYHLSLHRGNVSAQAVNFVHLKLRNWGLRQVRTQTKVQPKRLTCLSISAPLLKYLLTGTALSTSTELPYSASCFRRATGSRTSSLVSCFLKTAGIPNSQALVFQAASG